MSTSVNRFGTEELRERVRRLESAAGRRRLVLPFGLKAIDRHFPGGGLALGALHEVAGGGHGAIDGAAAALFAAGVAARTQGKVLWCITRPDLFAPALAQAGLVPDRVIYVEAGDEKSVPVCFEEGVRHGGLGAVVAEVARLAMTASRRNLLFEIKSEVEDELRNALAGLKPEEAAVLAMLRSRLANEFTRTPAAAKSNSSIGKTAHAA